MSSGSSSFLCYQGSAEIIPHSSTDARSRSSSINNSYGIRYTHDGSFVERKRARGGASLSSVKLKEEKEERSKKQKKRSDEKKTNAEEEPPIGYIHVRARRGQATDSHSLAERVRREKISERMKMLQGLVPGCDKVVGKALMLDEIINYVQSLQNQVEFLSMKLASVDPMLHNFAENYDRAVNLSEQFEALSSSLCMQDSQAIQSLMQSGLVQPTNIDQGTSKSYQALMNPNLFMLQGQGPISFPQDEGNFLMQAGNQREGLLNQVVHNSMCSFQ